MRARTFQLTFGLISLAIVTAPLSNATGQQSFQKQTSNDKNDSLKLTARYHIEQGTMKGFLIVKAEIPDGCYIYSISQKPPLIPSKLVFQSNQRIQSTAKFKPDKKPKIIEKDPVFQTRLEKHTGTVQFYVPIKIDGTDNLKNYEPIVNYSGQICSDQGYCKPINNKTVAAKFSGFFLRQAQKTEPEKRKK